MSNADYKVEAEVSTSGAVANLRAMRTAAHDLTGTLRELNAVAASGEKNLASMSKSITAVMAEQRRAADIQVKLAEARLREARAAGTQRAMNDRHNESVAKSAALDERRAASAAQAQRTINAMANDNVRMQAAVEAGLARTAIAHARSTEATERHGWAAQRAARNQLELTDNLSNTRYLLYDVGSTYRTIAVALEALPIATGVVAAAYQKDFAQVLRVTQDTEIANDELRQSLKLMATDIPTSFGDLSKIATLGAQVGIDDTAGLEHLTDTVARFTASVDGVPIETATLAFGRMKENFKGLDDTEAPGYFNKLGSAMAVVGAKTAATDAEIVSMLNQIAPLGAEAGFTTAQIVGLSGALASVRVQPELARGTLTRIFANINRSADEGAVGMEKWARVMRVSGAEALEMWKNNPDQFWTKFIERLNEAHRSGGSLTGMLDDVGIKASRDVSALTKLAVGFDVLTKSNTAANEAFGEGTALNEMSAPVFETVAARVQILGNAIKNFADSLGSGGLAPLAEFVDALTGAIKFVTEFVDAAPGLKVAINILLGLSAVAGIMLGLKSAQAFVLAGMVSLQQTMGSQARTTLNTTGLMRQFAVTMLMSKGATEQQANAMVRNISAMAALGVATRATTASIAAGGTASMAMATALNPIARAGQMAGNGLRTVVSAMGAMVGGLPGLITLVGVALVGAFMSAEQHARDAGKAIAEGLAQGVEEGRAAIVAQLKSTKNDIFTSSALPGDWGTSLDVVAVRMGVSIERVIAAMEKGKAGVKELEQEIRELGRARGENMDDPFILAGTWEGDANILIQKLEKIAGESENVKEASKQTEKALKDSGAGAAAAAGNMDELGTEIDDLDKKLKALNDTIFGTVNAEAAVGAAMNRLGGSLQESGSFGNDEGGRENLSNFQSSLAAAQQYYAQLRAANQITREEAARGYEDFVSQLIAQTQAMGGQLGPVEQLALQTVDAFRTTVGAANEAAPATMTVQADTKYAEEQVLTAGQSIATWIGSQEFLLNMSADTQPAYERAAALATDLSVITGLPWQVVMDALTDPANAKAAEMQQIITDIVNGTYVANVNADTSAAIANVQNFSNYARIELAGVAAQLAAINTAKARAATAANGGVGLGDGSTTDPSTAIPQPSIRPTSAGPAPSQVQKQVEKQTSKYSPNLDNLRNGFDKAAQAAKKAGDAGKKAGQDMADGINDAVRAADDYANRLKTGLQSAFDQQYGLQKATDDYYKALNAITKKREDEISQIEELRQKIRDLNNERNADLIDANKAKIEANISAKYGETDRQMDYENQAQTALDNAAAKQKDIDATQKQVNTIAAGMDEFNGYSDAAIANREALRNLEQQMLNMVTAYAATGASTDQVREYARRLGVQFTQQAGEAWGSRVQINALTGDLGRYVGVVNSVPYYKPTTITANVGTPTTGAMGAVNAFNAAMNAATAPREAKVWVRGGIINTGRFTSDKQPIYATTDPNTGKLTGVELFNKGGLVPGFASGGLIPGKAPSNPRKDNLLASVDGKGQVMVRSGEFIMSEPAVNYWGAEFMAAINAMKMPKFNMGGAVGRVPAAAGGASGPSVMALDASTLNALAKAIAAVNISLYTEDQIIAQSAARGDTILASKGVSQ